MKMSMLFTKNSRRKGFIPFEADRDAKRSRLRTGFTLVEILIVVTIIALLAATVLVGLGSVSKKGRDARRISDLKSIQAGVELYMTKNGFYPPSVTNWTALHDTLKSANIGADNIPNDPRGGSYTYYYGANAAGNDYRLKAILEDLSSPALSASNAINDNLYGVDCSNPTVTGAYCVGP